MSILFKPTGTLDISTASTDLVQESDGRNVFSGMMARCRNLILERPAIAETRHGSSKISNNELPDKPSFGIEQAGNRYTFCGASIAQNELVIKSGLTDAQWTAIKYNSFNDTTQRVFALNGTDRKKITGGDVQEWGVDAPSSVPVIAAGSSTGLTGDYNAKYTYAIKVGSTVIYESNPSDAAAAAVTLSNQSLSVTITEPTDPQISHIRIYRTLAGGSIYYHDQDIAIGDGSVDTTTADASLSTQVATDHNRPPQGQIVIGPLYNGICFIVKDNLLYWCKAKQPEYWPTNDFIEVGPPQFPIKCALVYDGQLYLLSKNVIWWIQGTTAGSFVPVALESLAGAPNVHGAIAVKGKGIYHLGPDGIYLYAGGRDKKISTPFEPIFPDAGDRDGDTTNGVQSVPWATGSHWLVQFQNKLYFHYGGGNVLVSNIDTDRSYYFQYGEQLYAPFIDKTNDYFLAGNHSQYLLQLEDPDTSTDSGTAVSWEIQSKDFTLQTRAHFPRWVKYDIDETDASAVVGSVILDGATHQTHSITDARKTNRRLVDVGNGERMAIRVAGNGPVKIYAIESE